MTTGGSERDALNDAQIESAYSEWSGPLMRFALRLCGNRDDAEDIVVETFTLAYRKWNTYQGTGSRLNWLFGIAVNQSRIAKRKQRLRLETLDRDLPAAQSNALDLIAIEQMVSRMPLRQREAFLLVKGEGRTTREAAEILQRPLGTVLYEVFQAIRFIRTELNVREPETTAVSKVCEAGTVNCEQAQQYLISIQRDQDWSKANDALAHAQTCSKCEAFLAFSCELETTLDTTASTPPLLLARIKESLAAEITPQRRMRWTTNVKLMKQITLSAATLTLAVTVLTLTMSGQARAAGARERFASMKQAVVARATSEDGKHQFVFKSVKVVGVYPGGDGPGSVWILVDGNLVEIHAVFSKGPGSDPPVHSDAKPGMSISLNPKAYESIDFGKDHDTLILTSKMKHERYVVSLDHKSSLPKAVSLEQSGTGGWKPSRGHVEIDTSPLPEAGHKH